MKFSIISAILLGAASTVFASTNYFDAPRRHSVFSTSDSITFVVDEVTNDSDDTIEAYLYRAYDDHEIGCLGSWTGGEISGEDNFVFTWDVDVGDGLYYVRVFEIDGNEEDYDPQDDVTRSHTFKITSDEVYENSGNKAHSAYENSDRFANAASTEKDAASVASTEKNVVAQDTTATRVKEADAGKGKAKEASNSNKNAAQPASAEKVSKRVASASRRRRSIYSA